MNGRILRLLEICLRLKDYGIDAFFEYEPHVEIVNIKIHENGWKNNAYPDIEARWISLNGKYHEGDATLEDAEIILENLLKSKEEIKQ